jgi:fucose 4-O-acetylase-like acetyltransferase
MNLKTENRLASADILKAISITAVVFIHGSSLIASSHCNANASSYRFNLILMLRFCVPVFVFLWAYFQEKSALKHKSHTLLRSRFYTLFIPFFFWSLIYFLLSADFKTLSFSRLLSKHWTGFGWAGQYYFIILFQLIILFPLIRWITMKIITWVPWIYIAALLFYMLLSYTGWFYIDMVGKVGDRPFLYWTPYVILGITYAHKNIFPLKLPLVVGLISTVFIAIEFHLLNLREVGIYLHPAIFVTTFLLLSSLEFEVSYTALSGPVAWIIQTIAKNTLGIFCLNPLVIIAFSAMFQPKGLSLNFMGSCVIAPILSTLIILITCILITSLLKRIKLGILIAN